LLGRDRSGRGAADRPPRPGRGRPDPGRSVGRPRPLGRPVRPGGRRPLGLDRAAADARGRRPGDHGQPAGRRRLGQRPPPGSGAPSPPAAIVLRLMREDDVRSILARPLVGVGSDNGPPSGLEHPRTWGCFPRLLGRYVREQQVLTWEQAVRKATWLGARQFRLDGRGLLVEGAVADLCVFDPATVGHEGTYLDPDTGVTGIEHVLLAGEPVVEGGRYT